ncbi:MAG: Sir2 family NAD-dependent protein deacetylase [Thermodesulfobacteriota bacterium]|nr:Sir2 family NAD-dependent protein deacetylase [Thermodesulfobacteriota bacterium]
MDERLESILHSYRESQGNLTVLTGAGISKESGIPTFRGKEGYWTVGSKEYQPVEMATVRMFNRDPFEVWKWYLYRKTICTNASLNAGHLAVAQLEWIFKDRFCLITQNVDGLHIRAGNSLEKTYQIHGNIDFMRCFKRCTMDIFPIPEEIPPKGKGDVLTEKDRVLLACPYCGSLSRPHVLWFDESYNEIYYRFESSIQRALQTDLLIVIGTSGATNLPMQVGSLVARRNATMIDINPAKNPFSHMAESTERGYYYPGKSSEILPCIVDFLKQ